MSSFLNQHVLVLNRLWQAVNICTARRALTLLFEGHAHVVLSDDEGVFKRSVSTNGVIFPPRNRTGKPLPPSPSKSACRG